MCLIYDHLILPCFFCEKMYSVLDIFSIDIVFELMIFSEAFVFSNFRDFLKNCTAGQNKVDENKV